MQLVEYHTNDANVPSKFSLPTAIRHQSTANTQPPSPWQGSQVEASHSEQVNDETETIIASRPDQRCFKIRMVSLAITPMTGHTITSGWKLLQRHGQSRRKPPPRTKYHTSPHGRLDHNSFAKPVTKTPYNIAHASRGKAWRVARACFTRPARVRPNERSLCKNACTCRCSALWMICPASSAATNNPSYILK